MMYKASLAVLGTGASFQKPEDARMFDREGCDMEADLLPSRLRCRTSVATKVAFAAAERACLSAGITPSALPVIFTSSLGEIDVADKLCSDIAQQHFPISPTRFHNSVHNTASGYWSISVGTRHPAMAMAAYQDSFALALLEAWSQLHTFEDKILLVCYEETPPQQMLPGNDWIGCAVAFVLASGQASEGGVTSLSMPYCEHTEHSEQDYSDGSPVLAAIALLDALEQGRAGKVQISPSADNTWFAELFHQHG